MDHHMPRYNVLVVVIQCYQTMGRFRSAEDLGFSNAAGTPQEKNYYMTTAFSLCLLTLNSTSRLRMLLH